ncbi:MAG: aldo/keto reductase [Gammaproteobacteria bacterium]|nr:aldo/keto reductase [Gammaproteobacteria bacterium]
MKYKSLGLSNLWVSELCLGTMTFGEEAGLGAARPACQAVFDGFIEAGGNFIDTANVYNQGTSERMLGEFIATGRDRLVIATKYSLSTDGRDPNAGGNHRKNLVQALEASLRRLGTPYVDLHWVHGWDASTGLAELMRALDDQVRAGKVLHLGISNAPAWVIASANTLAIERGWTPFTAMQLHYNLVERSIERDFFALAQAQDMAIAPWSPLAGGLLTGKFEATAPAAGRAGARLSQAPRAARMLTERNRRVAAALAAMAREIGCQPAQLALAWLCQRNPAVTVVPIIGARNRRQLDENLGCLELRLTAGQIAQLDGISALEPEYPEALLAGELFQNLMHGEALPRLLRKPCRG